MPLFWQSTSETGPLSTCQLILAPVRMLSVDARAITGLNGYQPSAVFLLDFMGFTSIYYSGNDFDDHEPLTMDALGQTDKTQEVLKDFANYLSMKFVGPVVNYLTDFQDKNGKLVGNWREQIMHLDAMNELIMREVSSTQFVVGQDNLQSVFVTLANLQTGVFEGMFLVSPEDLENDLNRLKQMIKNRKE